MKKIIVSAVVAFTVLTTSDVFAQQGFGTNTPDRSAAVDIVSSKRGLLIPRIDLTRTTEAGPVAKPENALFVYNKATANDVTPGFYYWEAANVANAKEQGLGRWVRFVSSTSGSAVTVSAGTNVVVTPTTDGHDTDYNVSVKGGNANGQVLVTKIDGNTTTTEWVNPQDFVSGTVVGTNGITTAVVGDKVTVGLGGELTKATTIETTVGADGKPGNTLAITGLEKLDGTTGKEFDAANQNIVIMGADGILKVVTPKALLEDAITEGITGKALTSTSITVSDNGATALLKDVKIDITPGATEGMVMVTGTDGNGNTITKWVTPETLGNTVTAANGLTKDGNTIKLGGEAITEATVLDVTATDASLAIKGLEELGANKVAGNNVVLADANGVLRETSPENLIGDAIEGGNITAKALKGAGITVTEGTTEGTGAEVASSLLKNVTLGIADNAITTNKIVDGAVTNSKIDTGAVSQEKLYAGTVNANGDKTPAGEGFIPVANADGTVTYKTLDTAVGAASLHTDGKIVIGDNQSSTVLAERTVLAETTLSIKQNSISSIEITDGTVANVDLAPNAVSADKMTSNTTANGTATPAEAGKVPVADGTGGVTYEQITGELLNGKALTSESIVVTGGAKALLDATKIEIKGGTAVDQVLVTIEGPVVDGVQTYITKWVAPNALGNTVTASNGLTKDGNTIKLGGEPITEPTVLAINNTTGSLAITGLEAPSDNKAPMKNVAVGADGKLYAITNADKAGSITINEGGNVTITNNTSYSQNQEEVVIEVTLVDTDTNLTLPTPTGVEGQTISIKIANTTEAHNGYLSIKSDNGAELAYGAMPYQGWIIKSNGAKWIVVGRN